jgi:hypothetical protein
LLDQLERGRGRIVAVQSRSAGRLCLILAAVVTLPAALALFSSPKLAREAREYNHARALGLPAEDRSGWHEEPAVVLGEGLSRDRSKTWKLRLALRTGESQTLLVSRGNLRGFVGPGSPVRVQFWRGKITQIQSGDRRADTYSNPDWLLDNNRVGALMCILLFLAITALLLRRVRLRVRFRIGE